MKGKGSRIGLGILVSTPSFEEHIKLLRGEPSSLKASGFSVNLEIHGVWIDCYRGHRTQSNKNQMKLAGGVKNMHSRKTEKVPKI